MEPKEVDFEFPRGDTLAITFNVTDTNKENLTEFDEIYFTMKKSYTTQEFILQKRLTRGDIVFEEGQFNMMLSHKDTAGLAYGKYVYDIQVVSGEYYKTVCIGAIQLTNEATFLANE